MAHRIAKSLATFRAQANERWPGRSKLSDGWIGDARHAAGTSDHNPNRAGVVQAFDLTHDPANGVVIAEVADALRTSRDKRIKYLICNGQIMSGEGQTNKAWVWRPYTGKNKHDKHLHISVRNEARLYDDETPWILPDGTARPVTRTLRNGDSGADVVAMQRALVAKGYQIGTADGQFGPKTERAVRAFQRVSRLEDDGIVGPATRKALGL